MQQDIELQSNSEVQKAFKRLVYLEPAVLERVTVSGASTMVKGHNRLPCMVRWILIWDMDALGFGNSVSPLCVILPFDSP